MSDDNNNRGNRNNSCSNNNNNRGRGNGRQFYWAFTQNIMYDTCSRCGIGHIPSQCPNRDPLTIRTRPSANFANTHAQSCNASANWHSDIGENSHVTIDLEAMDNSEAYYGGDVLHVGNDKGLPILHIGSSKLYSPQKTPSHHGYRCLDISTGRLYIARHVRFIEAQFPIDILNTTSPPPLKTSPYYSSESTYIIPTTNHPSSFSSRSPISSPSSVSNLSPTSQTSPESSNGQPSPVSTTSIPTPPPPPPITQQRPANLH
ncbi:hypothetical protein Tco_0508106 [Tanacetum coccineum]